MTTYLFPTRPVPALPVNGCADSYPIHRIFCVGRNYAAHAAEMGTDIDRDSPIYFTKSGFAYHPGGGEAAYPPGTSAYHHEVELVVAIGKPVFQVSTDDAMSAVYGYAVGLDMTRRDLQLAARDAGRPWDTGKDVEQSAIIGPMTLAAEFGAVADQRIALTVNGETRQDGRLTELIWKVDEIIADLSRYYHLEPGDLIMTGTPSGIGPVERGDTVVGTVEGLSPVEVRFVGE